MRSQTLKRRLINLTDLVLFTIADSLPNRLVRWVLIVAGNRYAVKSGEVVPEMIFMDVVKGFDQ